MKHLSVIVDLSRCEAYGQCVYAAPAAFQLVDEESLEFDPTPEDATREHIERAAKACPVQAISVGWTEGLSPAPGANGRSR
jgi:ferredoxin